MRHVRKHQTDISYSKPLLGRKLVSELHTIAKTRNDFAHRHFPNGHTDRTDKDAYLDAARRETMAFLLLTGRVCDSDFVRSVTHESTLHDDEKSASR